MFGIVLCGGESSRMGSDKGLLAYDNKTWAETAFEKLDSLKIPIKISLNEHQFSAYSKVFKRDLLIIDNGLLEVRGPLLGVLSVHEKNINEDLLILASDLLFMDPTILKELVELHKKDKEHEVFIYTNDNEPEPLCGIYTSKALKRIVALQKNNRLIKHSMKFVLGQLDVCSVPIKNRQKKYFRNFNKGADLKSL